MSERRKEKIENHKGVLRKRKKKYLCQYLMAGLGHTLTPIMMINEAFQYDESLGSLLLRDGLDWSQIKCYVDRFDKLLGMYTDTGKQRTHLLRF